MTIKILQYTFDSVNNPNGVKPTISPSSVKLTYEDSTVGKITTRIVYADTMPTKISFGNQPVLTLDYINVTEVQSLYGLFWDNQTIKRANISNQIAKNLTDIYGLFYNCQNIEKIDMSNLIIEKPITNSSSTFAGCGNLYELNLKGSKIDTNMYMTFNGCSSLTEIDTSAFITNRATSFRGCFATCSRLKSIDISTWDTSAATEMWAMFEGSKQLENIVFETNFKTSLVTNMDNMFSGCNNLKSINTLCFDTSSLQRCGNMFQNCTSLKILNLSSFNTSNVTTNGNMFNGLTSDLTIYRNSNTWTLTDTGGSPTFIDVNGKILGKYTFDNTGADCLPTLTGGTISSEDSVSDNVTTRTIYLTSDILPTKISFKQKDVKEIIYLDISSNITDCSDMFYECYSLVSINTDNWNTTNVLNMKGMFAYCTSLQSLDLSSFNTSNVTNMQNMFIRNDTLTSLNLSSFDTSNVTDMGSMFQNCSKLTSLDLSNFNTSKITSMYAMFQNCSKLTSLNLSNFNTGKVTNMTNMFNGCSSLTSLNLSSFDTSQILYINNMFNGCSSLTSLNLSNFNTSKVTNMSYMFQNCSKLTSLDLSNFNTSEVTNMIGMFGGCSKLTSLNLSNFNTSKVTDIGNMFNSCATLTSLDLSNFDTSQVTSMYAMFSGCSKLTSLDLSNFNVTNASLSFAFQNCNLRQIGLLYSDASSINKIAENLYATSNCDIYYYDADTTQLTPVDNVTFIKYKFPNTVSLPPHINLYALPDGTRDELDIKTGILTRKIGTQILDGSEAWRSSGSVFYTQILSGKINPYKKIIIDSSLKINLNTNGNLELDAATTSFTDVQELKNYLNDNNAKIIYQLSTPTTEKLILNYNHSCEYGMVLPKGAVDYYDVVNSKYHKNIGSVYLQGDETWQSAEEYDKCVRFGIEFRGTGESNIKPGGGLYCDNDLFPNIDDDSDVEHCRYASDDSNILYFYVDKTRLLSPDLIGWQIWQQENPYTMYFELADTVTLDKPYEELDPNLARWEMMDSVKEGTISYTSNNNDGLTLYPNMTYVAPSVNNFDVEVLEPNTTYTVYAENVGGSLNLGGNTSNFTSGTTFTSGENKWLTFNSSPDVENIMLIKGDTTDEVVPYFTGINSVVNPTIQSTSNTNNSTITTNLTLRSSESGVKDSYNVLTGEYIRRVSEDLQELPNPIITTLEPKTLLAYENGKILLSSESGLIPTLTYATPSTNTFHLPSMKTGTRYTLKYPSASGNITIGNIKYNINSPSMLFTTPLTIVGDTSAIIFSDENPQDVMLIEGAYNTREIPLFTGVKSVVNPTINIIDNGTEESRTYRCQEEVELRSLPNGVADKLDIVGGKLTRAVGIRPYQEGDEDLPNTLTDGYNTIYQLSKPTVSSVTFVTPVVTSDSTMHLSSEALIPQLNYRVPSNNNFPLDLLEPNKTYTLYANTLVSGSYTLGGTHNGYFTGTEVIALGDVTNNLLTFDGDLGLSDVVLIKGNSMNSELPYFEGLKTVENATITIAGMQEEENSITLDDSITLRACGDIKDTIDMVNLVMTQRLSEITLKGTEPWSLITTNESINDEYVLFGLVIGGIKSSVTTSLVCDKFNHKYQSGEMHNQEGIYAINNQLRICVKKTTIGGETVDAIKTWLGQNNTRVIYALINPIEYQLQNSWTSTPPTSYNNRTTISSQVVDSLKPMITVTIATTTLEQIINDLQVQNELLAEENTATMMALTEVYEMMFAGMETYSMMSLNNDASIMTLSLDEEPEPMEMSYVDTNDASVMTLGLDEEIEPVPISSIGMVYVKLIKKGLKTIDQVPSFLLNEVKYGLQMGK